jgi:hypothetical protein
MSMWRSPSWSGEQCQFLGRIETGGDRRLLRFRVLRHGLEVLLTPPLRVAGDMARVTAHGDGGSTPISGRLPRSGFFSYGPSLCEKSHRQKKRRIIFFVVFSRRQLLALFDFKSTKSRRKF